MNDQASPVALEPGYELHWYRVERVLGQGAFGITYLAHDINLDRQVAIKEYLPGQFSVRASDLTVKPTTAEQNEDFEWGLKRFISEARTLTKFEHPNLVRVFNVFEMNGTAYMVMNYELGKSLQQILKTRKTLGETEIIKILIPLMSGLEIMHGKGFVHRDIKPGNIFIRSDGSPVLLDFGSARQTRSRMGRDGNEDPQTLTTLVSPGYAPIEQYGSKSDRQGPWTDIYGLAATLYRSIAGVMPVAAIDRSESIIHDSRDPYLPLTDALKNRYSENFLRTIDHALSFKANDRPRNIPDWRKEFNFTANSHTAILDPEGETEKREPETIKQGTSDAETIKIEGSATDETEKLEAKTAPITKTIKEPVQKTAKTKFIMIGTAVVLVTAGLIFMLSGKDETSTEQVQTETTTPVQTVTEEKAETPVLDDTPATVEPEVGDESRQQQIEQLLDLAQEDIKALRLTSPKDNNAFDKYLSILKLDPANEQAKAGIKSIADKYIALAYSAIRKNKLDQAESYINRALVITPETDEITAAKESLAKKRQELATTAITGTETETTVTQAAAEPAQQEVDGGEDDEGFWEKMKKWHEEGSEQRKQYENLEGSELDKRIKEGFK